MATTPERPAITIDALALVQSLPSGRAIVRAAVEPETVAFEREDEAIIELRLFLEGSLDRRGSADAIARHAVPSAAWLLRVRAALVDPKLPRRVRRPIPVEIPCVVVPTGPDRGTGRRDAWLLFPTLHAAGWAASSEVVEEVATREAERLLAALAPSPDTRRALFGHARSELARMAVHVERDRGGATIASRRRALEQGALERAHGLLTSVGRALHRELPESAPPIVAREREIRALGALLGAQGSARVAIVGPPLVGKSAIVHAWIRRERDAGRKVRVYQTSAAQLVAGMSFLGQWQERLHRVLDAAERLGALLYFDDLGDLLSDRSEGGVDLVSGMKSWLEQGRLRLIGEMSDDVADRLETRQPGFVAALHRVRVAPLDRAATALALAEHARWSSAHERGRPIATESGQGAILDLADRFLPYQPFPGKALRLMQEIRAADEAETRVIAEGADGPRTIDAARVHAAFALTSGIPEVLLREDRRLDATDMQASFARSIAGQEDAIRAVVETLCVVKAELSPGDKPLATYLFVGPTGVGKTELARTLAAHLFGSADRLKRFDMSEYADAGAAMRLIGAEGGDGLLTRAVRQQPFSVVLLDEIEKAHPAVFDLLLQVTGEGRLSDGRGRTTYFHDAIVVMTSNLGATHRRATVGIGAEDVPEAAHYLRAVERAFRPELVNRIDRIVPFHPLGAVEMRQVVRILLGQIEQRRGLVELGVALAISDAAADRLADGGTSEHYGARALRRHVEDALVAPIAHLLSRLGDRARHAVVAVHAATESVARAASSLARMEIAGMVIDAQRGEGRTARRDFVELESISELRRSAQDWTALTAFADARSRVELLVSEMSWGDVSERDRRRGEVPEREIAELQTEHHRLSEPLASALGEQRELESIEELALASVISGYGASGLLAEARATERRLRRAMAHVLVAELREDAITLLVEEKEGRALHHWLFSLLDQLGARGWTAWAHLEDDRPRAGENWPSGHRFGPARAATDVREQLDRDDRKALALVLVVRGRDAGALLALEQGLHRWMTRDPRQPRAHFVVTVLRMRAELEVQHWASPLLSDRRGRSESYANASAAREVDPVAGTVAVIGGAGKIALEPGARDGRRERYFDALEQIAFEHLRLRLAVEPLEPHRGVLERGAHDDDEDEADGVDREEGAP